VWNNVAVAYRKYRLLLYWYFNRQFLSNLLHTTSLVIYVCNFDQLGPHVYPGFAHTSYSRSKTVQTSHSNGWQKDGGEHRPVLRSHRRFVRSLNFFVACCHRELIMRIDQHERCQKVSRSTQASRSCNRCLLQRPRRHIGNCTTTRHIEYFNTLHKQIKLSFR